MPLATLVLPALAVSALATGQEAPESCSLDSKGFLGFWTTNYDETITVCSYDEVRSAVLARTHWPDKPFNNDSASLLAVQFNYDRDPNGQCADAVQLSGVGSSFNGKFTFTMRRQSSEEGAQSLDPQATGKFEWLDGRDPATGRWEWEWKRSATQAECDMVVSRWSGE